MGPTTFVIYIHDLDECTENITIVNKFADDTKFGQKVVTVTDRDKLLECLDKLLSWAATWCMEFNIEKCKLMHPGRTNENYA